MKPTTKELLTDLIWVAIMATVVGCSNKTETQKRMAINDSKVVNIDVDTLALGKPTGRIYNFMFVYHDTTILYKQGDSAWVIPDSALAIKGLMYMYKEAVDNLAKLQHKYDSVQYRIYYQKQL